MEGLSSFRGVGGRPLVLLHSGFGTWAEWRGVIELLDGHREALVPTLPGSDGGGPLHLRGRSMLAAHADRVEELLDAAGWNEPVEIAGSSFGGVCALELAARGRASAVTALAPPWVAGAGAAFYGSVFATVLPGVSLMSRLTPGLVGPRALGVLLHGSLTPVSMSADDARGVWRSWGRFPLWRTGLALGRGGHLGPGMPDFDRVEVPVRLVWGGADRIVPGWMRQRWREALPDARVSVLGGMPHCPHLRDPASVAALLVD